MTEMSNPLPEFVNPPVVEVALSVQFKRLANLRTPHLGVLWQEFRGRFPRIEEHAPLDAVVEKFGIPRAVKGVARIEMLETPPTPRCWFLDQAGNELIQVQTDRFVHNWRKIETDATYPRYRNLRATFETELKQFRDFVQREGVGDFVPNQCEVTYVNHLASGGTWKTHSELDRVITVMRRSFSDDFMSEPEDANLRLRFQIPGNDRQPAGRLHVTLDSAFRNSDQTPLIILTLTARGAPLGEGVDGTLAFMDLGREWVVRGFTSITTSEMHKEWGRLNAS